MSTHHLRRSGTFMMGLGITIAACGGGVTRTTARPAAPPDSAARATNGPPPDATATATTSTPSRRRRPPPGPPIDLATTCTRIGSGSALAMPAVCDDLKVAASLDADAFAKRYDVSFTPRLPFDPAKASGIGLVTGRAPADKAEAEKLARMKMAGIIPLNLSAPEQAHLSKNGFVLAGRDHVRTFTDGYVSLYAQHLPLYVTADSILHAVHRSYDAILALLESGYAATSVKVMLEEMRGALASTPPNVVRADVDVYLAVALSLLTGTDAPTVGGGDANAVASIVRSANDASGTAIVTLFGQRREEDFSQFKPRGHYAARPDLQKYFRAMMWLGRTDYRIVETDSSGEQVFSRRNYEAAMLTRSLVKADTRTRYDGLERFLSAFVGEVDSMTLSGLDDLVASLGPAPSDATVKDAVLRGEWGKQRIASKILKAPPHEGTFALDRSFTLFGQRYVADSHVLSNVVYDRVPQRGPHARLMPDPRDVAFAAFGNDHAGKLLVADRQLETFRYAPELAQTRLLLDAHGSEYWGSSLYAQWLSALRTLSPPKDMRAEMRRGLPAIATTEPWSRRMLNTQLASWAELRHDTILYAKQSYTMGVLCEFPDAYVDPYPAFFAELEKLALRGVKVAEDLPPIVQSQAAAIKSYFHRLQGAAAILGGMADKERRHVPFTSTELAFINEAVVKRNVGCGGAVEANGWYPNLFFAKEDALKFDPTIADVHTQPTDEHGNDVGRVLHIGTGRARLMVAAVDTCHGPRVYTGVVSSYFEKVTEGYDRWTDERWGTELATATPADVPWMSDLVAR